MKSNLSQLDLLEDQISGFFNIAESEIKPEEAPLKSLSAESSNIAMQFDDPKELFAHI